MPGAVPHPRFPGVRRGRYRPRIVCDFAGFSSRCPPGHTLSAAPRTCPPEAVSGPPPDIRRAQLQEPAFLFYRHQVHCKRRRSKCSFSSFHSTGSRAILSSSIYTSPPPSGALKGEGANVPFPVSSPRKPIGSPASISMSPPADTRRAPRRLVLPASAGHMPGAVPQTRPPPASAGAAAEQHVACGSRRGSVLLQLRISAPPDAPQTKFRPSLRPVEKSSPDA